MSTSAIRARGGAVISQAEPYRRLKPGPGQSPLDVASSQRHRLQRAVLEVAARDGLERVTLRKITKVAHVSNGAFYSHFTGLDDCVLDAYRAVMTDLRRITSSTRSPLLTVDEQLSITLPTLLGRLTEDPATKRFVLIEAYGGGPAALTAVSEEEARLGATLTECLDRRGSRFPEAVAAQLLAALLHCARGSMIDPRLQGDAYVIESLMTFARQPIEGDREIAPSHSDLPNRRDDSAGLDVFAALCGCYEEAMVLKAIVRLVARDGFLALTPRKVSSASGIPASRLGRHFSKLADGYLKAVRLTCRFFFSELTSTSNPDRSQRLIVDHSLRRARLRVAAHPTAARLTFRQILEAGKAGVTCREALVTELAAAMRSGRSGPIPATQVECEARAAALWESLGGHWSRHPA